MIVSQLSPSTCVGRGDALSTEISGRLVLMNARQGNYVSLDDVGNQIWQRLERSMTVGDLCTELQALYDVERPVLERDVIAFLESLLIQGLVAVVPAATGP